MPPWVTFREVKKFRDRSNVRQESQYWADEYWNKNFKIDKVILLVTQILYKLSVKAGKTLLQFIFHAILAPSGLFKLKPLYLYRRKEIVDCCCNFFASVITAWWAVLEQELTFKAYYYYYYYLIKGLPHKRKFPRVSLCYDVIIPECFHLFNFRIFIFTQGTRPCYLSVRPIELAQFIYHDSKDAMIMSC